jgi:hypothetical protein
VGEGFQSISSSTFSRDCAPAIPRHSAGAASAAEISVRRGRERTRDILLRHDQGIEDKG